MHGLVFLQLSSYPFISVMYLFLLLVVLLFSCIISFTIYRRKNDRNKKLWKESIAMLISQAIFFNDTEDERVDITYKIEMLLQNRVFRNTLIDELILAKKNLSGASITNLKKLYNILELDIDSLNKLNSRKWHIKAKGIHELSMMDQVKYLKQIFRLTNNKNEFIRSEAQCALVGFYGFPGLRFLNVVNYPISQWQQIQLLNKLNDVSVKNTEPIYKWLQSSTESVKVFALKLATLYSCYEVYSSVIVCLQSTNLQVKLNALEYVKKLPQEDTAEQLITTYSSANKTYKLAALDALESVGNEKQVNFLLKQLHDNDDEIKVASAKALSCLHPSGAAFLQTHLFADENPWRKIFLQLKKEIAA